MKLNFKDPTTISLILANFITIIIAVWFSWNLLDLLWIYWWQNVIIGFFTFLKLSSLKGSARGIPFYANGANRGKKVKIGEISNAFFFALHYGLFHLVYASFLGFGLSTNLSYVAPVVMAFFINHLFSFLYYRNWQKGKQNAETIMFAPYKRIIPMHFTIFAGGFLASLAFFGTGTSEISFSLLIVFLLIKTAVDVIMHSVEHEGQQPDKP
ncbi:MAG: hypothetical protein J4415_02565 [Candidatus Diapherotrites archaeon]|uniref:Uncharacterized protein n=1 Tax=Candidatus Iainarchaeum sp. TaxID=3101447 RepID=A0A8T4KWI2_9ARCH|nr:hypothetical protein [Candidatus Diapherotrites archaeon]